MAKKVESYILVVEGTIEDLVRKVNEKIAQGWQPLGGAFKVGTDWGIAQAMVK
jgi:hypothetical protein